MNIDFKGPAGRLEGLLDGDSASSASGALAQEAPRTPRAAVVFAHPHPLLGGGGTMHTKAVYQGAKGLARIGCAVLRFNFRGVGRSEGTFDSGAGEREDFSAAIDFMAAKYPGVPIWAAGFSFGSWIALEVGAADPRVSLLIGIAPPWAKDGYAWSAIYGTTKPKFFVQGESDELCAIQDMWAHYAKLKEPKELVIIVGANHLFEGKTSEVGEALEDLLGDLE